MKKAQRKTKSVAPRSVESSPSSHVSPQTLWFGLALLWTLIGLTYSNSFNIAFQFDDTHTVQANMYVRSLKYVPRYFVDATTSSYRPENSGYRPLTTTALALGFALSGSKTWGYHLIKLLEHGLVAVLILLVSLRLLPRDGAACGARGRFAMAWLGALVFGVHRANTETVDYISQIASLQAGLFLLLSFHLFLKWRDEGASDSSHSKESTAYFAGSVLCYFAAMLSKEEGITLPAVIALHEWLYHGKKARPSRLAKLLSPYISVAAVFVGLRTMIQPAVADASRGETPVFIYFITQFRSWLYYGKLFFWPVTLNSDNLSFDLSAGLDDWRVWGALAVHASIWAWAWVSRKKHRFASFAVGWIYLTILPASSVFVLVEAVNEHRMYIPYMMLSPLVVWAAFEAMTRLWPFSGERGFSRGPQAAGFAALIGAAALGAGAYSRNEVWKTDLSLWEDVYAKNPESPRAMNILGITLLNKGNYGRSSLLLEKCHRIAPTYLPCIVHLSLVYAHDKRFEKGLALLQEGHRLDPDYVHINYHLGMYYKDFLASFESARPYLAKVYQLTAGRFFQATIKMAEMALEEKNIEEGMRLTGLVLSTDASNAEAWEVQGKGYLLKGDFKAAGGIFGRLQNLSPEISRYALDVANVAERQGDWQKAGVFYDRAVAKSPDLIQGWEGLARAARAIDRKDIEAKALDQVATLKKNNSWTFIPSMFMPGEIAKQVKPGT